MKSSEDCKIGETLSLGVRLRSFGHIAASTSGSATFRDIGTERYSPGVELIADSTVVPAVKRRGVGPEFLQIEFSEPVVPGGLSESRRLLTRLPIWVEGETAGGLRHLFMTLGESAVDQQLLSLAEFAPRLWSGSRRDHRVEPSDLLVLDTLAQILFVLASNLHSRGRTIGLLDPANVLFFFSEKAIQISEMPARSVGRRTRVSSSHEPPDSGTSDAPNFAAIQVLLPDLFLDCDPSVNDVPPWIKVRGDYRFLWDSSQSEVDVPGAGEKLYLDSQVKRCSPDKDVRNLARMCAWALTGKKMNHVPEDIVLRGGCWDVIRSILIPGGQRAILSATDVADSLAVTPLMEHVQPATAISAVKSRTFGGKIAIFGVFLLLAGVLAFYFFSLKPAETSVAPMIYVGCPDCDPQSRLHAMFSTELLPLVAEFHADDRYRFPEDGPAVFEPLSIDAEAMKDQTRLLREQLSVLLKAQKEISREPTTFVASERSCIASELRAAIARARQHFEVADSRTVIAMDGKVTATDMVAMLKELSAVITTVNEAAVANEVAETLKILQEEDPDTRQLYKSDSRFATFFQYASALTDVQQAKRFIIRHVRQHHLHEMKELEL